MVVLLEFAEGDRRANLDVAVVAKARSCRNLVKGPGNQLDLLVVGGNTEADQPVWHRQPLEHVDGYWDVRLREQLVGQKESGWAGADDGNPQRR